MIHQTGINHTRGIRLSDEILTQVQPVDKINMCGETESKINAISCSLIIKHNYNN